MIREVATNQGSPPIQSIQFDATLPHEFRILQSRSDLGKNLLVLRGKTICQLQSGPTKKLKSKMLHSWFSCLSEFSVDSLKMDSMILDGINVLKCDIKFQTCRDEMPVINFAIQAPKFGLLCYHRG